MFLLLLVGIGFYLYKTGQLQKWTKNLQDNETTHSNEAKQIIAMRYASGQISAEEYNKLKSIL